MSTELMMPTNRLTSCPQSFPASRFFLRVDSLPQMAKVLEFQHQSFQWIFRTHFLYNWRAWSPCRPSNCQESSKTPEFKSINFWCSAYFLVQHSHPYVTTGKTIALTIRTFDGKVMSLLFDMLSRLVIAFLPRSKRVLILCLQSPSAVSLEPKKIKSLTVSTSICHEVMGLILIFHKIMYIIFIPFFKVLSWRLDSLEIPVCFRMRICKLDLVANL